MYGNVCLQPILLQLNQNNYKVTNMYILFLIRILPVHLTLSLPLALAFPSTSVPLFVFFHEEEFPHLVLCLVLHPVCLILLRICSLSCPYDTL